MIVHCSAGVGRTGTFIALYKLMEKIDEGVVRDTIDVYNEVFQLRQDRCFMVKKGAFIYTYVPFKHVLTVFIGFYNNP